MEYYVEVKSETILNDDLLKKKTLKNIKYILL